MGLFGKLFDKKSCSICGGEIGLLGNRKLEDGNMCKNCASKLSIWFDGRRHSTVDQINEHLNYREENLKEVEAFNTTQTFGGVDKLCIDEKQNKFIISKRKNLMEENPDVIEISKVTGCDVDIDENRHEEKKKDSEGKQVSYDPPRYTYSYDFYVIIRVNHPYFDMMKFKLNSHSVEDRQVVENEGRTTSQRTVQNPDYQKYEQMANEVRDALLNARQQIREDATPKKAVTCPCCGATTMPDSNGCCEYCGSSLNN
ncbi:hypothetical protein P261_01640 [Lachnospiraceae bacterium TWA4]|nr:hypothetical protein P261_01640 [Lachnospiraceae bacterium TWA4]